MRPPAISYPVNAIIVQTPLLHPDPEPHEYGLEHEHRISATSSLSSCIVQPSILYTVPVYAASIIRAHCYQTHVPSTVCVA
jgi:hypothetical protein